MRGVLVPHNRVFAPDECVAGAGAHVPPKFKWSFRNSIDLFLPALFLRRIALCAARESHRFTMSCHDFPAKPTASLDNANFIVTQNSKRICNPGCADFVRTSLSSIPHPKKKKKKKAKKWPVSSRKPAIFFRLRFASTPALP